MLKSLSLFCIVIVINEMLQDTVGVNLQTYRQQPSFESEGQTPQLCQKVL